MKSIGQRQHSPAAPDILWSPERRSLDGPEEATAVYHARLGDCSTGCAVKLLGIDESRVGEAHRAVFALVQRHDLLRSCIELVNKEGDGVRRLMPLENNEDWPKLNVELARSDSIENDQAKLSTWKEAFHRGLDRPFLDNSALVRFLLYFDLERGDRKTYLIITAHHALFDGRSLEIIVRDFLSAIETASNGLGCLPPLHQPTSSLLNLIREYVPKEKQELGGMSFPAAKDTFNFDHPGPLDSPSKACFMYESLSDGYVNQILTMCRRDRVRMTSVIITAMVSGLAPCLSRNVKETMGFLCCVDLRRYIMTEGEDGSNWLGNLFCVTDLGVPAQKDSPNVNWTVASRIQSEIDAHLVDRRFLTSIAGDPRAMTASANQACDKILDEGYHGRDLMSGLSNLGRIRVNPEGRAPATIRATEFWYMSRLSRMGGFFILHLAYVPGHGMFFSFTYPHPVCEHETAERIVGRIMLAMREYASRDS